MSLLRMFWAFDDFRIVKLDFLFLVIWKRWIFLWAWWLHIFVRSFRKYFWGFRFEWVLGWKFLWTFYLLYLNSPKWFNFNLIKCRRRHWFLFFFSFRLCLLLLLRFLIFACLLSLGLIWRILWTLDWRLGLSFVCDIWSILLYSYFMFHVLGNWNHRLWLCRFYFRRYYSFRACFAFIISRIIIIKACSTRAWLSFQRYKLIEFSLYRSIIFFGLASLIWWFIFHNSFRFVNLWSFWFCNCRCFWL